MADVTRAEQRENAPRTHLDLQQAQELHRRGDPVRAQSLCEEIVESDPAHVEALMMLGMLAGRNNDLEKAAMALRKAVEIDPANIEGHFHRGDVLKALGRWEEALASFQQAVAHRPDFVEALCNCGNTLRAMERWEDALQAYDQALAVRPDYAMVHSNRGVVLRELGRSDEALASYDRAIALEPGNASAHFNRGILLLSLGRLQQGWLDHEWRWEDQGGSVHHERRNFRQPRWSGEQPIEGKTILLYGEQGYGDTLQFCRYVPLLAEMGARVVLEVRPPLVSLLADLEGVSQIVASGGTLPEFDYQCPLMSLPLAFDTALESIPLSGKYLLSDPSKVAEWQAVLGDKRMPRIGLTWSGNAAHASDRYRSIQLAQLIEASPKGVQLVCLQKDVRETDRRALESAPHALNVADRLYDFSDTAALCECLDLVISVDTSVAHLSGALGKPTWVLLASMPDWRWLLDRDDSPWYRSVKLYRQDNKGSWNSVLERVTMDLMRRFALHGTPSVA